MPKTRNHGDGALFYLPSRKLWRGVANAGFKPDGRRDQRYVHAKTQTEARAKLKVLLAEIEQYGTPLDKTMTVESWADHWLTTVAAATVKPNTLKAYRSVLKQWIIPVIGRKTVAALKPSDVRAVTQRIIESGRSTGTASKAHNLMSAMFESARLDGVTNKNVIRDVVAPTVLAKERGAITADDAYAILQVAHGRIDGARWFYAFIAGMRQGERLGATLDSIDLEREQFSVKWALNEVKFKHGCSGDCGKQRAGACPQRQYDIRPGLPYQPLAGRLVLLPPKSGKTRTFPIVPLLMEPTLRYLRATVDWPNPHGLIFRNRDGSPITAEQDNDEWRGLLREAGVITDAQALRPKDRPAGTPEPPTSHWARHTTATMLMELGVEPKIIGEVVGHGTERVTRGYQHVSSAASRSAIEALSDRFRLGIEG